MVQRKPVLLIEDDQDYERLVCEVLANVQGSFEVKSAPSLAAGLPMIDQYAPEVILLDLNIADSSGYATFLRVRERARGIPIVVLTGLDDDQIAIRAVEDGAQDYLVKSLVQPRLLARCMNMALSRQRRQDAPKEAAGGPGKVFSFLGSKGGVGTSTTALNMAAMLARNGFETVVIEIQQGRPGTLSLYLQTEPTRGLNSLLEKPADTITTGDLQSCVTEALSGLYLLCPSASGAACRAMNAGDVQCIVSAARRQYQFVVLDLPARMDEGVTQALKLSDSIILLSDRELSALHCAELMIQQIRTETSGAKVNVALVDRTWLETPLPLAEVKRQLKVHPVAMIPHAAAAIVFSHSAKTPLVLLYPDDPFSLAHLELAEHLLNPAGERATYGLRPVALSRKAAWRTIPETTYG